MLGQDGYAVREFRRLHFVYHLLEQCIRAPWVNGVRNPSTTAAEAVALGRYPENRALSFVERWLKTPKIAHIYPVSYLTAT